jgi:hypothetical protein
VNTVSMNHNRRMTNPVGAPRIDILLSDRGAKLLRRRFHAET